MATHHLRADGAVHEQIHFRQGLTEQNQAKGAIGIGERRRRGRQPPAEARQQAGVSVTWCVRSASPAGRGAVSDDLSELAPSQAEGNWRFLCAIGRPPGHEPRDHDQHDRSVPPASTQRSRARPAGRRHDHRRPLLRRRPLGPCARRGGTGGGAGGGGGGGSPGLGCSITHMLFLLLYSGSPGQYKKPEPHHSDELQHRSELQVAPY